jgi:DNA polymerase I-like protein with 3'-5' exonuclease and polymerase domains
MRTSYNIAGTTTGRFSSSFSEFGTGGNLQNIEEGLRSMFIADSGMKLGNFDAEQGESRVVGAIEWNLFKRGNYLDACESGDLHTTVARICWPELHWTGDLDNDRELAEEQYYRHYSRRFMCKKLGHGSNYGGRPQTLATQTKTDLQIIVEFQSKYFKAFPAHQTWHAWVEEQIRAHGKLISLTGRERHFFGRRDADDVIREAIAYDPQGSLSDIVNQGMLNVYRADDCQLLLQNHDSILVQYPEKKEDEIIPRILQQLRHAIPLKHGRTLVIPYGCKTGWNWGEHSETNPDGLKGYKSGDKRRRTPSVPFLDRKFRRAYS